MNLKIEIIKMDDGAVASNYFVGVGHRYEGKLTPDEALFVVAQLLTHPDKIPSFLRTRDEHVKYAADNDWLGGHQKDLRITDMSVNTLSPKAVETIVNGSCDQSTWPEGPRGKR